MTTVQTPKESVIEEATDNQLTLGKRDKEVTNLRRHI